ncbi:hybrid-cluster NAD(P)-dependent oxidoreductase [Vibrio mimicus]|uniref:hybrid-cluster NAD(P)-dependent oxidoreductase n=1 Tax=Vibrio mimicus TaxID=674 RepID=UPI002F93D882
MSTGHLSQINVFPVKSLGGIALSSAWVEKQGLTFDRRFMLALSDGSMVTARKFPQMVLIKTALRHDGVLFSAQGHPSLTIRYADFKLQPVPAQVWADNFTAYTTTDEADDWFSTVLGIRVELLYSGEQSNRVREKVGHNVSFADGYPMLVISQASLDELNRRSPEFHSMDQFRTNLVVSGTEPFDEDSWKRIRIGEVEFEAVKPCERCILTTVEVKKGAFRPTKEPLRTLSQFRANERGGVFFGQNLVAKNEGMIRAGDPIEVLEYKEKEVYPDQGISHFTLTCVEREEIARDFVTFWLEPAKGIAPQYLPGQHLPIEMVIDGESVQRYYTLSSSPSRPGRLAISVKRIDGGRVSNWLQDHLQIGTTLTAQHPAGHFHLETTVPQPLLLLSAGSGVTPMLSMLRYLADHNQVDDVVFYHQCRSEQDIPCRAELDALAKQHAGLTLIYALTQPSAEWQGEHGRLALSHIKRIPDLPARQVFVCGPDGFMQKAKNLLQKQGVAESAYHQEAFGIQRTAPRENKSVTMRFNGIQVEGNNQKTLLEQAEAAGVKIANSCRAGICGACKVTVKSGLVQQPNVPALADHERAMGMALACCAMPDTDVDVEF